MKGPVNYYVTRKAIIADVCWLIDSGGGGVRGERCAGSGVNMLINYNFNFTFVSIRIL